MYNNNPYAQGGWYNPGNPLSINQTCSPSQPSIYGALPGLQNCAESCLTFALCPTNPDILNCSVVGPRGSTHFVIRSDYHSAPITYLRTPDGTVMGYIEWSSKKPFVCITDSLSKQPASQWLHLSADKKLRTMVAHDRPYVWVPKDNEIALYAVSSTSREPVATISKNRNLVNLRLTSTAISSGLVNPCIVATVLLQCGRNID